MGFTLTPTESGDYEISGSYESARGQTVTYSPVDEATGEHVDQFYFGTNSEEPEVDELEFGDPEELGRNQQYLDALIELHPQLPNAVQWAGGNWDPELAERFNASIDAKDWDTLNQLTERLLTEFESSDKEPTEVKEVGGDLEDLADELELSEELAKVNQDSLGDLITLQEHVFSLDASPELADSQMHQAESLYDTGDYAGALVSSLSAQYHAGNLDVKAAVKEAVSKLGMRGAIDAYTRLAFDYSATGDNLQYGYDSYDSDNGDY